MANRQRRKVEGKISKREKRKLRKRERVEEDTMKELDGGDERKEEEKREKIISARDKNRRK